MCLQQLIARSLANQPVVLHPANQQNDRRHPGARRPLQSGMTIIEVMIAVMILIMAVMMLFSAMSSSQAINDTDEIRGRVIAVMQRQLEILQSDKKATVISNITPLSSTYDCDITGLTAPSTRTHVVQVRRVTGTAPAGSSTANLIVVTIDAQWVSRGLTTQNNNANAIESINPITYYYADPTSP